MLEAERLRDCIYKRKSRKQIHDEKWRIYRTNIWVCVCLCVCMYVCVYVYTVNDAVGKWKVKFSFQLNTAS